MHPWPTKKYVVGHTHIDDLELIKDFYLAKTELDGNFFQRPLFSLDEPLDNPDGI